MTHVPNNLPRAPHPPSSVMAKTELNGASLSLTTLLLVACSTIGGLLFTATYLVEGAIRPGYSTWQQPISALSLGPGGWVQQANFIIFGVLVLCSAVGWRQALVPGVGATWYPLLQGITGLGLIVDGIFSQDPAPGYPVGAVVGTPTPHGQIHSIFAIVTITGLALTCFVLARRFAVEPRWHGWVMPSILTGLLTIVFITIFGSLSGHAGTMAGLFERVATGVHSLWGVAILTRLLLDKRG